MTILTLPRAIHVNSAGRPYGLAKLYHYRAGTLTLLNLYTDHTYGTPHAQPIEADANGLFPAFYLNPSDGYNLRLILKDKNDVEIYDEDNIPRAESSFGSAGFSGSVVCAGLLSTSNIRTDGRMEVVGSNPRIWLNESDRGTDLKAWDIDLQSSFLSIRSRTDADGAGKNVLVVGRVSTTTIDSIEIGNSSDSPSITLNGITCTPRQGNFTGTLTGMTGSTTGPINYFVIGSSAYLYLQGALTGTSNTTAMTLTGLPSILQTSGSRIVPCALTDNGSIGLGFASFTSPSGTVTFGFGSTPTGAFTNSGTKGLPLGCVIQYPL